MFFFPASSGGARTGPRAQPYMRGQRLRFLFLSSTLSSPLPPLLHSLVLSSSSPLTRHLYLFSSTHSSSSSSSPLLPRFLLLLSSSSASFALASILSGPHQVSSACPGPSRAHGDARVLQAIRVIMARCRVPQATRVSSPLSGSGHDCGCDVDATRRATESDPSDPSPIRVRSESDPAAVKGRNVLHRPETQT